jgi:phosphate transport system protein
MEKVKLHFDEELKELKNLLLKMSILVEEMIDKAGRAFLFINSALAFEVIQTDKKVDRLEVEVDELAHQLLAKRQPIAHDLRLITMVLKMNANLERIGDHAVNIAERAAHARLNPAYKLEKIETMSEITKSMLRDALKAFVGGNAELAKEVLLRDDVVDELNRDVYEIVQENMRSSTENLSSDMRVIMVAHNLERIADLATNIAEDVIFLEEGKDVRHWEARHEDVNNSK